jgi:adenylate cyclase
MPYLHITHVDGKTAVYTLKKDETTLGRKEDNDIVVPEGQVSRLHAKVIKKRNDFYIVDQGSFNGIRVNGDPVQETILREGDEIRISKTTLLFSESKKKIKLRSLTEAIGSKNNEEAWDQQIISSISAIRGCQDSASLLATISPQHRTTAQGQTTPQLQDDVDALERTNKVLYVLYEVSRQLNSLQEFEALLDKIMDLIFKVIDTDHGFLFLIGEGGREDLRPVVIKSKDSKTSDSTSMRASRTIITKVIQDKVAVLTTDAMDDSRFSFSESIVSKKIHSAMCVPLWDRDRIIGIIQLTSTRPENQYTQNDLELLTTIGCQMAMVIGQAQLNQQIRAEEEMRKRLERFHSPQVVEMILKGGQDAQEDLMEPKEVQATVLFTDIAGFTPLAEKMHPREVTLLLNKHFSHMTDIIFEFGGTLDKYIGDGLMAVFGAPVEETDDAERAVGAALKMREEFLKLRDGEDHSVSFDMRLGINSGSMVAGNIGSPRRMDYTVIGDPVNIASRLETEAEANQILIGEDTYRLVKGKFKMNKVGAKKLKGKSAEILAYEVIK